MILAAVLLAACVPLPTCSAVLTSNCATPTPTIKWDQQVSTTTALYRAKWRRAGETTWRGSVDLRTWDEVVADGVVRVLPGVVADVPMQRLVPTTEQLIDIEITVVPVLVDGTELPETSTLTVCMPKLCVKPGPCS